MRLFQRVGAVAGLEDFVAIVFKANTQQRSIFFLVVDHQDDAHTVISAAGRRSRRETGAKKAIDWVVPVIGVIPASRDGGAAFQVNLRVSCTRR